MIILDTNVISETTLPTPSPALMHGAAVATRNVSDFEGLGIELINPWKETD